MVVEEFLDGVAVAGTDGYLSRVNLTEVRYIIARKYDRTVADDYIDWLIDLGLRPMDADVVWSEAADFVLRYNPALGDSFALATAAHVDATLLVGGDDYDAITDVPIERFREGSV